VAAYIYDLPGKTYIHQSGYIANRLIIVHMCIVIRQGKVHMHKHTRKFED